MVPQDDCLDRELTVPENLFVYGRYFGLRKSVMTSVWRASSRSRSSSDKADARVEALSGGMRRRLTIARSLINEPEILLLDEPTTGLDPQARHVLWDRLFRLKHDGVTLILTTHYMDEAEQLCDRLAVMDGGRIVAEGSPRELIETHVTREVLELRFAPTRSRAPRSASGSRGRRSASRSLPDRLIVYADDGEVALVEVHAMRPQTDLGARSPRDARGRLPEAHRALAGRLRCSAPGRPSATG